MTSSSTPGFARRFAPYKRPILLPHDLERLLHARTTPRRPVQFIIAGMTPAQRGSTKPGYDSPIDTLHLPTRIA
jgi:glucan phosphorylase